MRWALEILGTGMKLCERPPLRCLLLMVSVHTWDTHILPSLSKNTDKQVQEKIQKYSPSSRWLCPPVPCAAAVCKTVILSHWEEHIFTPVISVHRIRQGVCPSQAEPKAHLAHSSRFVLNWIRLTCYTPWIYIIWSYTQTWVSAAPGSEKPDCWHQRPLLPHQPKRKHRSVCCGSQHTEQGLCMGGMRPQGFASGTTTPSAGRSAHFPLQAGFWGSFIKAACLRSEN